MRHGYAGPVYSSTQRALWPWYVPQLGVRGLPCDMPDSSCSNDERINDQRRLVCAELAVAAKAKHLKVMLAELSTKWQKIWRTS